MEPADNDGKRTGAYLHRGRRVSETQEKQVRVEGAFMELGNDCKRREITLRLRLRQVQLGL